LIFFSFYTWSIYHHFLSLFFCNILFSFFFFFLYIFFLKKYYFFIFYTMNIYRFTIELFISFFLFLSLFFFNLFCNFVYLFLKHYYTKTKEIVFHCSNCNIVPSSTILKISLSSYMFLLMYMIFTICKHRFFYSWLYFFIYN